MTTELAIMMRAGLSLDNALKVLVEMSHKVQMQAMLQSVLDSVKAGMPLSQALGKHHDLFGDFYINMVRSGEASGQMSGVLNRLVEHMARQRALRDSVVSATIYPAILLGVAVLSLVAMLGFVVPQFEQLFNDMGDALPLPTQFVMGAGPCVSQLRLGGVHRAGRAGLGLPPAGPRVPRAVRLGNRGCWACRAWVVWYASTSSPCSAARWARCWATASRC